MYVSVRLSANRPIRTALSLIHIYLSLVSLSLETGRTHQIRVHMRSIGHPLPGDFLYCPDYRYISRQPLHSYLLRFEHPITGKEMEFTAGLPEDMKQLLPSGI